MTACQPIDDGALLPTAAPSFAGAALFFTGAVAGVGSVGDGADVGSAAAAAAPLRDLAALLARLGGAGLAGDCDGDRLPGAGDAFARVDVVARGIMFLLANLPSA